MVMTGGPFGARLLFLVTLTAALVYMGGLLYWDNKGTPDTDDDTLEVGTWGEEVFADNIIYTKFGGVVGFTMTGMASASYNNTGADTWGADDVKFNPTSTPDEIYEAAANAEKTQGYVSIPDWSTWPDVDKPTSYSTTKNLDFISSSSFHTVDNVKDGWGDACQLAGHTAGEIRGWTALPAFAKYRLPTNSENNDFFGYDDVTGDDISLGGYIVSFGSNPKIDEYTKTGNALPGVGYRYNGNPQSWGSPHYWSSTPSDTTQGYGLSTHRPSDNSTRYEGRSVRCVRN